MSNSAWLCHFVFEEVTIDWLIDWLTDCSTVGLLDCLIEWSFVLLTAVAWWLHGLRQHQLEHTRNLEQVNRLMHRLHRYKHHRHQRLAFHQQGSKSGRRLRRAIQMLDQPLYWVRHIERLDYDDLMKCKPCRWRYWSKLTWPIRTINRSCVRWVRMRDT